MSVSTITAFQSAVAALAPASGNVYNLTYSPKNPNGTYSCVLTLNGVSILAPFVYNAAQSGSQYSAQAWDQNASGITVSFVSPDGVRETADAQRFLNSLQ